MKERIMLDPAKVKKHSADLMENNPHNRPYTKHLMMESGLTSAQLEGYTHVSPDEAADLADLLGCDLSDLVPNREVAERAAATAAAPIASAGSGPMCSRKGCYKRALPGKKICQEHMDIVMTGKNRSTPKASAPESDELLEQIGIRPDSFEVIDEIAEAAPTFEPEPKVDDDKKLSREVELMIELHQTLVGIMASELIAIGSDKLEVRRIMYRLNNLANELAGVR